MKEGYMLNSVLVIAVFTALTRFLPFFIFGGKRKIPSAIQYLGSVLPFAVIGMLVVYCLKEITAYPFGLPELISVAAVVFLHKWKRHTLFSIFAGTAIYMVLIQAVFV